MPGRPCRSSARYRRVGDPTDGGRRGGAAADAGPVRGQSQLGGVMEGGVYAAALVPWKYQVP